MFSFKAGKKEQGTDTSKACETAGSRGFSKKKEPPSTAREGGIEVLIQGVSGDCEYSDNIFNQAFTVI
ncbi:MAG: hypothetical protein AVO33_11270 [delta proteobacterium ML8_F1]|nr:MAG: hypothetical protein AVO33_11270 [delta proteobacterium ML8_F1]